MKRTATKVHRSGAQKVGFTPETMLSYKSVTQSSVKPKKTGENGCLSQTSTRKVTTSSSISTIFRSKSLVGGFSFFLANSPSC